MSESLRARASHAFFSVLLAAGLVLPLLGVLLPSVPYSLLVLPLLLTVLFFELACLNRACAAAAVVLAAVGGAVWLFTMNGAAAVADVARALSLRLMGVETALPLVLSPAVILLTILLTLVSCLACVRSFASASSCSCISQALNT